MRLVDGFLLILVNDAVIVKLGLLARNLGGTFNVITGARQRVARNPLTGLKEGH